MLLSLCLAATLLGASYEEGMLLTYRGEFQPVKLERPNAGRRFELAVLIGGSADGKTQVHWLLTDAGSGTIAWQERFGTLVWSPEAGAIEGDLPGFSYDHASGKTRVNIAPPLPLFRGELAAGAEWTDGKTAFDVDEGEKFQGRATWDVTARALIGRRRTQTVDRDDRQILALRENVFVGQGEEHLLTYKLAEAKTLDAESMQKSLAALEAWTVVRRQWTEATEDRFPQNISAARKAVAERLPDLKKDSTGTFLATLADAAGKDFKAQDEQKAALGALRSRLVGKPLPAFELQDASNKKWASSALAGKVVVLHFWSYRDENLHEPYGQVGYLDFLARRHEAGKVQVLGVAVQPADAEAGQNQRSLVRKFREFMNLSYPVLLDDGSLLEKLGDPAKAAHELPLFVVVDAQGNVVEYKAGLYDVRREEGLSELEAVVKKAAAPRE